MGSLKNIFVTFLLFLTSSALAQNFTGEGFDRQSQQEIDAARIRIAAEFAGVLEPRFFSTQMRTLILQGYQHLDPKGWVPRDLLEAAVIYFDANKIRFPNQNYISIVDYKPRSDRYRYFIINMDTGDVERYHTTHGVGSDPDDDGYATTFGNVPNSGKSSLGFIRTAEIYSGKYDRSLRLDGLSSTNSNLRARAVVFHGWDDVHETNVIQGRSWGCITIDWRYKDALIDKIGNGSLMYAGVSN